jgi:DNA-binding NarL/FixJ family response regulator
MIRVVLVDDHPVVRAGLRKVLDAGDDIEVVGDAGDAASAIALIERLRPDVVVLDMHLGPGRGGIDVLRHLNSFDSAPRVLVVTVFDNDLDIDAALAQGATGYILKDSPEGDLVRAVRGVDAGQRPLDPRVAARVLAQSQRNTDVPSTREFEVLAAVAEGLDNAAIARQLYISQATVKSHLASLFDKLNVHSRTGAVAEARRRGHLR